MGHDNTIMAFFSKQAINGYIRLKSFLLNIRLFPVIQKKKSAICKKASKKVIAKKKKQFGK